MRKLLVDLELLLDVLLDRAPHAEAASRLWAAAEERQVTALIPAHRLAVTFQLLAARHGEEAAWKTIRLLLQVFGVAAIDAGVLQRAASLRLPDFDDAVMVAAAEAAGCQAVVTRHLGSFSGSLLPAIDADVALSLLADESGVNAGTLIRRRRSLPREVASD
jgi:predicted nucleic acid-binding protein